jgi:hypothetical protein
LTNSIRGLWLNSKSDIALSLWQERHRIGAEYRRQIALIARLEQSTVQCFSDCTFRSTEERDADAALIVTRSIQHAIWLLWMCKYACRPPLRESVIVARREAPIRSNLCDAGSCEIDNGQNATYFDQTKALPRNVPPSYLKLAICIAGVAERFDEDTLTSRPA